MAVVLVADGDDAGRLLAEGAEFRGERIGDDGGIFAFKAETGMAEILNFHGAIIAEAALPEKDVSA